MEDNYSNWNSINTIFQCAWILCLFHLKPSPQNPSFNDPDKDGFWTHCGKKRKCWWSAFSFFPTVFSTLSDAVSIIWTTCNLLSANAVNLHKSEICYFGKDLTCFVRMTKLIHGIVTVQIIQSNLKKYPKRIHFLPKFKEQQQLIKNKRTMMVLYR